MYRNKTFLALIPARSGSKGLPDKNIRPLRGKPLMAHTIEATIQTGLMDDVVVSTDSERYADIARRYGADVPFLRPEWLSTDTSLASEYIVYTLDRLRAMGRAYDYFVLLQPTSPLRMAAHIAEGVQKTVDEGLESVVAFSETDYPVEIYHALPPDFNLGELSIREANRQEHAPRYRINGMLYICACDIYLQTRSFYGPKGRALIIDSRYAVDIDGEYDFVLAEFLMNRGIIQ